MLIILLLDSLLYLLSNNTMGLINQILLYNHIYFLNTDFDDRKRYLMYSSLFFFIKHVKNILKNIQRCKNLHIDM